MILPVPPYTLSIPALAEDLYEKVGDFFRLDELPPMLVKIVPEGPCYAVPLEGLIVLSIQEVEDNARDHDIDLRTEWLATVAHEVGHLIVAVLATRDPGEYEELKSRIITEEEDGRLLSEAYSDFIAGVAIGLSLDSFSQRDREQLLKGLAASQEGVGCVGDRGCEHNTPRVRAWNLSQGVAEGQVGGEEVEVNEAGEELPLEWTNNVDELAGEEDQEELED